MDKFEDYFLRYKNFINIQRIDQKSLLAIQLGSSNIWQKFQDDWLTRFFGKLCTNLENLRKIDLSLENKMLKLVKSVKKCWKSFLEDGEMIFTLYYIFETYSEFDGKNFCKNIFLKKSFLKVLPNQNFLIFCSILVTKIEQTIRKCWLVSTFKNDFFKNLFFQKTFPSNSEQVWKTVCMVKIISLTSRSFFNDFSSISVFIFSEILDFFQNDVNLCNVRSRIYKRESLHFFVRDGPSYTIWPPFNKTLLTCKTKKFFWRRKKITFFFQNKDFSDSPKKKCEMLISLIYH